MPNQGADAPRSPEPRPALTLGSSRLRIGSSAFAPTADGKQIVALSGEGVLRRFDATTGDLLGTKLLGGPVDMTHGYPRAAVSADGAIGLVCQRASGVSGEYVRVFDLATGRPIAQLDRIGWFKPVALSPDGQRLVFGQGDAQKKWTLRQHDLRTGATTDLGTMEVDQHDIQFSADGRRLVVGRYVAQPDATYKKMLVGFDLPAGRQVWTAEHLGDDKAGFVVSVDGRTVVSSTRPGPQGTGFQVIETDLATGRLTERFVRSRLAGQLDVPLQLLPDGRTLVVLCHSQVLALLDLTTGQEGRRFPTGGFVEDRPRSRLSADGRTLLLDLSYLQKFDLTTGRPGFTPPPEGDRNQNVHYLAFSADGKELFTRHWASTAARWDAATGKPLGFTRNPQGQVLVPTARGTRTVFPGNGLTRHEVYVHDAADERRLGTIRFVDSINDVNGNDLCGFVLAADGKAVLTAHAEWPRGPKPPKETKEPAMTVTACDLDTGTRQSRVVIPEPHRPAEFSPCGRWVLVDGKVYPTRTAAAPVVPEATPDGRLVSGRFSPDGTRVAGTIATPKGRFWDRGTAFGVWETATGKLVARISTRHGAQMAMSPDNRAVAVYDGERVRVFELPGGQPLASLPATDVEYRAFYQPLAFSPDGKRLAVGHADGTVTVWDVP